MLDAPFDIEIFVSGFASRSSGPGFNSRAAKAFLRLAKGELAVPSSCDVDDVEHFRFRRVA